MISNTIAGGVFDDADHNTTQMSLIDLFEPAGITWKAYMEGYTPLSNGGCNPISEDDETLYARWVPFLAKRKIVPLIRETASTTPSCLLTTSETTPSAAAILSMPSNTL